MKNTPEVTGLATIVVAAWCFSFAAMQWMISRNHSRYEQTTKSLCRFANQICNGHQAVPPERDAWGAKVHGATNAMSSTYISQGANADDATDDIILQIKHKSHSYSISYTYNSHHFSSAVVPEPEKESGEKISDSVK